MASTDATVPPTTRFRGMAVFGIAAARLNEVT
jgi:hypothetical protein